MVMIKSIKNFFNRYGKIIIRVGGITGLIVAVFFLVSGIYFLCQKSTSKDGQGFFSTWNFKVEKNSRAIILEPDGIEFDGQWDMGEIGLFKVIVDTNTPGKELFIGSSLVEDARSYLTGVEYDKVTGLWIFPARADYQRFDGENKLADPVSQDFWVNRRYGTGTNQLTWNPEQDNHSVVFMNADSSAGLDLNVQVKTMVGILFIAGAINIIVGIFILLLSLMAILYAGRAPNVVYPKPLITYPGKKENHEAAI
jgi:hypothetical protein